MKPLKPFEPGEQVEAFVMLGINREPHWTMVEFERQVGNLCRVVYDKGGSSEQHRTVEMSQIYRKIEADPEACSKFFVEELPKVVAALTELIKLVGLNIELKIENPESFEDEGMIELGDSGFYIRPEIYLAAGFIERHQRPGWLLAMTKTVGGGYWTPPDHEEVEFGIEEKPYAIAALALRTIVTDTIDNWAQCQAESEMYQEMADGEL